MWQVKYEMLRRHRVEGRPVTEVATAFGVSRQAFYAAETAFTGAGLPGLLPRPRGPKRAHKCTDEILAFVEQQRTETPARSAAALSDAVREPFGVTVHPRSLARALVRRKKTALLGSSGAVTPVGAEPRTASSSTRPCATRRSTSRRSGHAVTASRCCSRAACRRG